MASAMHIIRLRISGSAQLKITYNLRIGLPTSLATYSNKNMAYERDKVYSLTEHDAVGKC
jgi:hypothetical protein